MENTRATKIEELDTIRLTVPLEGPNVFDDKDIYQLPVGTKGTVMHIFWSGEAFEVEFVLFPNPANHKDFVSVQIPVRADQCEPFFGDSLKNAV